MEYYFTSNARNIGWGGKILTIQYYVFRAMTSSFTPHSHQQLTMVCCKSSHLSLGIKSGQMRACHHHSSMAHASMVNCWGSGDFWPWMFIRIRFPERILKKIWLETHFSQIFCLYLVVWLKGPFAKSPARKYAKNKLIERRANKFQMNSCYHQNSHSPFSHSTQLGSTQHMYFLDWKSYLLISQKKTSWTTVSNADPTYPQSSEEGFLHYQWNCELMFRMSLLMVKI